MIFSRSIPGSDKKKSKLNWYEYWIEHCLATGFQSIRHNFMTWMDLVWFESNWEYYSLLPEDKPFDCCYNEFWFALNDDDVYPKEFLEHLMQMTIDIDEGKMELIPFEKLQDLLNYDEDEKE